MNEKSPNQKTDTISHTDVDHDQDWKIDVVPGHKVNVPSFIRLFIIRRILINHSAQNQIEHLVTEIADTNERDIAQTILTRLLKDGIKTYMSQWFDEQEQIKVIETIFNQIIVSKFSKEYENTITFPTSDSINNNNNIDNTSTIYQSKVFNMNDIMCLIFQFIYVDDNLKGDLFNCSLVNSHWLYHVYNPSSIHCFDLTQIAHKTLEDTPSAIRVWQRLTKAKIIDFNAQIDYKYNINHAKTSFNILLTKLSMFKNITTLDISLNADDIEILKAIIQQCKNNIESCSITIDSEQSTLTETSNDETNVLSPLMLINCKDIRLYNLYFYIGWTKVLKTLNLLTISDIGDDWCQYVIDKCDCTGIHKLYFDEISFKLHPDIETKILKSLALKFENLKVMELSHYGTELHSSLLLFWKLLTPIISKNNTYVTFSTSTRWSNDMYNNLLKMIQETKNKIDKFDLWFHRNSSFDHAKPVILNSNTQYLSLDNWIHSKNVLASIIKFLQSMKLEEIGKDNGKSVLPRLQKIRCDDGDAHESLSDVNDFVTFIQNITKNVTLFIVTHLKTKYPQSANDDDQFLSSFDTFCRCLLSLMVNQQVPIDIELKIMLMKKDEFQRYKDLAFDLYFKETSLLKHYKKPKGNNYCQPLEKPNVSFEFQDKNHETMVTLHVCNAKVTDEMY